MGHQQKFEPFKRVGVTRSLDLENIEAIANNMLNVKGRHQSWAQIEGQFDEEHPEHPNLAWLKDIGRIGIDYLNLRRPVVNKRERWSLSNAVIVQGQQTQRGTTLEFPYGGDDNSKDLAKLGLAAFMHVPLIGAIEAEYVNESLGSETDIEGTKKIKTWLKVGRALVAPTGTRCAVRFPNGHIGMSLAFSKTSDFPTPSVHP